MKTSYYIACYTKCKCTPEEYEEEAEKLKALFTQLLTDTDRVYAMTHTEKLTSVHSELQVSHESAGLVGKCVVDIEAPERVQLDKSRLSVFLKVLLAGRRYLGRRRVAFGLGPAYPGMYQVY